MLLPAYVKEILYTSQSSPVSEVKCEPKTAPLNQHSEFIWQIALIVVSSHGYRNGTSQALRWYPNGALGAPWGLFAVVFTQKCRHPKPCSENDPFGSAAEDVTHGERRDGAPGLRVGEGGARIALAAPGGPWIGSGPRDGPNSSRSTDSPFGPGGLKPAGN